MSSEQYVIGVDYGTDSVRSVIADAGNGSEIASAVFYYPRWKDGQYCDPYSNRFRQHPLDYIEGLEHTIRACLSQAGASVTRHIKAISVDTTGSSPVAVDETGTPLGLLPGFEHNPNALFVLWKDHSSVKEAAEINAHAEKFDVNYLRFVGGVYSSEWFWAKLLHVLREDEQIRKATWSWVEHCDWIPFLLTGGKHVADMKRGVCSAGHKALWAKEFAPAAVPAHTQSAGSIHRPASLSAHNTAAGSDLNPGSIRNPIPVSGALPPDEFFATLDPLLKGFTTRLFTDTYTADQPAGRLSEEWAARLGLTTDIIIGVGAFDAHMGAVGGQIEPYHLSKVMGTSTCDMLVAPLGEVDGRLIKGICGQVPGSVIPGMMGMEAGQSAFGDAYAWFRNVLAWPLQHILANSGAAGLHPDALQTLVTETIDKIIPELSKHVAGTAPTIHDELALDWLNGRRTPDANQLLKGAISGLSLGSDAPKIFRAIVESTCFGARAIVERFNSEGIPVKGLIGLGGVAKKSPFIMQMMADTINMPIRIHASEQTCALGAAMFAATAAGIYDKIEDAMKAMGQGFDAEYRPDPARVKIYDDRYRQYGALGRFIAEKSSWK
ncbi:MAG TPA: ribulokinase [Puia sp.]|nr:ribulokinase [Puia sp.]